MLFAINESTPARTKPFDEQRALLLLSGLSLTRRQAFPSGTFLIRTQICLSGRRFSRVLRWAFNARAACRLFLRCCISLVPKGFVLSCSSFVGRSPTEAKPKIQGFTPTDKSPAVRLSSARGENMKKIIFIVLTASFLCFGSCCIAIGAGAGGAV